MSDAELDKRLAVVREYFHHSIKVTDAAKCAYEIRILRPDLNDQQLAKLFGISSGAISMLLLIARASPEDQDRVKDGGLIEAHTYLKRNKDVIVVNGVPIDYSEVRKEYIESERLEDEDLNYSLEKNPVEASPEAIRDNVVKRDHDILEEISK